VQQPKLINKLFSTTAFKIIYDYTVVLGGEVLSKGLSFFANAHLARTLGSYGFGVIGLTMTILSYFEFIIDGGFGVIGGREIANNKENLDKYVTTIVVLRIILASLSFLILVGITIITLSDINIIIVLLLSGVTLLSNALMLDWLFFSLQKSRKIVFSSIIVQCIFAIAVLAFVKEPTDLITIPVIQIISKFLGVISLVLIFIQIYGLRKFTFDFGILRNLILDSGVILVGNIFRTINYSFGTILISYVLDITAVGQYTAASKLVLILVGFVAAYLQIFLAPLTTTFQKGLEVARMLFHQSLNIGASIYLPILGGGIIISQKIIFIVYGPGYEKSEGVFQILLSNIILVMLAGNYRLLFIVTNRQKFFLWFSIISAFTNVVVSCILVTKFSLIGVALASVVSELVMFVLSHYCINKHIFKVSLLKPFFKPLLATICMVVILYECKSLGIFANLLIGIIVYLFFLTLLNFSFIKQTLYQTNSFWKNF